MKIALITDQHIGVRNDAKVFLDYFKKFYADIFWPYIDANGIDTIISLGDTVDRRKFINFATLQAMDEIWIQQIRKRNLDFTVLIGNHDTTYRNTNALNAMDELYGHLQDKDKFDIISGPTTKTFKDGTRICLLPWICEDNHESTMEEIEMTNAHIAMGHLELAGFELFKGHIADHGEDAGLFTKFAWVGSGHYHRKSDRGNIHYLGSTAQMTWTDHDDPKGFHIFDTETLETEFIPNPYEIFHKVVFDGSTMTGEDIAAYDYEQFADAYVKVIAVNRGNPALYEAFTSRIDSVSHKWQSVEPFAGMESTAEDGVDEVEDTLTTLTKTVEAMNFPHKNELVKYMISLYNEALVVEN